jgi:6-phosphogluconolactonase
VVTKVVPGLLIATPDAAHAAKEAASRMTRAIRDALRDRGLAHIALSGGSSPMDAYAALAKETIDWNKVHVWFVDERAVAPDQPRSNFGAIKKAFIDAAGIAGPNVHRMRGEADDLKVAASEYETELRDSVKAKTAGIPALDLVVLGVGDDGHTASLFPGEPTLGVTDRLVADVAASGDREARLTLTVPMIENTKAAVIIVLGKSKHAPLERIWTANGDNALTPGRIIRGIRGSITWVIDRAAGGMG